MKLFLRLAVGFALPCAAGATGLGLLAPYFPSLELINHFRPLLLLGTASIAAAAWASGPRPVFRAAALLASLTLALTLLPFVYRAGPAQTAAATLKVATVNLWVGNQDVETLARFLETESADVVVLQEADRMHGRLIERVKSTYPHAYCPDRACSVALISRRPWLEAGKEDLPPRRPLLVWARFALGERTVRVVGLHVSYPFASRRQAEQIDWLVSYLGQQQEPLVVAGDFNLTPFSWKMLKLLHGTGLKLHLVTGFTWPAQRYIPLVLLDNVLATPAFGTVSARIGPYIGSDHLPLIVELGSR